jgi:hypothetical protein
MLKTQSKHFERKLAQTVFVFSSLQIHELNEEKATNVKQKTVGFIIDVQALQ